MTNEITLQIVETAWEKQRPHDSIRIHISEFSQPICYQVHHGKMNLFAAFSSYSVRLAANFFNDSRWFHNNSQPISKMMSCSHGVRFS